MQHTQQRAQWTLQTWPFSSSLIRSLLQFYQQQIYHFSLIMLYALLGLWFFQVPTLRSIIRGHANSRRSNIWQQNFNSNAFTRISRMNNNVPNHASGQTRDKLRTKKQKKKPVNIAQLIVMADQNKNKPLDLKFCS